MSDLPRKWELPERIALSACETLAEWLMAELKHAGVDLDDEKEVAERCTRHDYLDGSRIDYCLDGQPLISVHIGKEQLVIHAHRRRKRKAVIEVEEMLLRMNPQWSKGLKEIP